MNLTNDREKFLYDLTVLIPVHNAEDFLEETVNSVINQKIKNITYEVLLINDGSIDKSEKICKEYANLYNNFSYYKHKNSGVSYTRNRGLNLANGEYILFLDSDDLLKQNTLQSVVDSFKKYEGKADILTYPLFRKHNEYITPHIRNEEFKKNGVDNLYNIYKFPNLNQCTMNIVVKNLPENERVYFNENLKQSEDALYNTQMIIRTGNIIHTNNGGYLYNVGHESTVNKFKSPVDIKEMILDFFDSLIEISLDEYTKTIPRYVQSMILYELNWRFVQNTLFPYHLDENKFNKWMSRMKNIFKNIEIETILNKNLMDFYHKMFLIKTFKSKINYINNSYGISFECEGKKILDYTNMTLVFNKIKIKNNDLNFIGFVKAPLLDLVSKVELIIKNEEGVSKSIPLSKSPASYYKTRMDVAEFLGFDFNLSLNKYKTVEFFVNIDNHLYNVTHWFENNVIFKKFIGSRYVVTDKKIISYESNTFKINIDDRNQYKQKAKNIIKHQQELMIKNNQVQLLKFQKYKGYLKPFMNKRRIWLYNDRVGVLDNAYYQFKHDIKKKDGIYRYYVIREEDQNNTRFPNKNIIIYGSLKHKILYYFAELVLTSFKEFIEYSPLSYRANNLFYSEMKSKIVYLQHGVLNAHTPWLYGKHVTNFDKFLISSKFEKTNLLKNYGYNENDLIESGMPRLDNIIPKEKKKKILLAPSWRKSLIKETVGLTRTIDTNTFIKSKFYNGINKIINSEKLNSILKKNGYTLDVKMHPIFMEQSLNLFETDLSNINILKINDDFNINDYRLFITDFSSYMFDFIKSMTKIVFYMPDYDYFLSGNHIYNRLDFDVSKFSGLFTESDDLIEYIDEEIRKDFNLKGNIFNLYNDFYHKHTHYKEHLYQNLKNITYK